MFPAGGGWLGSPAFRPPVAIALILLTWFYHAVAMGYNDLRGSKGPRAWEQDILPSDSLSAWWLPLALYLQFTGLLFLG